MFSVYWGADCSHPPQDWSNFSGCLRQVVSHPPTRRPTAFAWKRLNLARVSAGKAPPIELVWVSVLAADRVYIYIIPPLLISDQFLQKYFRCKTNILEYCFLSHGDILTTPSAKNKEHTVIIIRNSGFSFICSRVIYPGVVKVIYLGWGLSWILPGRLPGFFSLLLSFLFWCCLFQGSDIVQRPCTEVCLLYTYLIGVYSSRFSL